MKSNDKENNVTKGQPADESHSENAQKKDLDKKAIEHQNMDSTNNSTRNNDKGIKLDDDKNNPTPDGGISSPNDVNNSLTQEELDNIL